MIPLVLGHRGAPAEARENTLEAFAAARAAGADGVELDVRLTSDGTPVVHHDHALAPGAEIHATADPDLPAWLPTLAAALDATSGMLVDVELKSVPVEPGWDPDEAVSVATAALVAGRRGDGATDDLLVTSFSRAALARFRDVDGSATPTGLLLAPAPGGLHAGFDHRSALSGGHGTVLPHHANVSARSVAAARDAGLRVIVWTVDDPERLRVLLDAGVDGIVTNRPEIAVALRNAWRTAG